MNGRLDELFVVFAALLLLFTVMSMWDARFYVLLGVLALTVLVMYARVHSRRSS